VRRIWALFLEWIAGFTVLTKDMMPSRISENHRCGAVGFDFDLFPFNMAILIVSVIWTWKLDRALYYDGWDAGFWKDYE